MSRIQSLLQERFKQEPSQTKMAQLVQKASSGSLNSFDGIFHSCELTGEEKEELQLLLNQYRNGNQLDQQDYTQLCNLTVEIKAITKQAILLHGERIQRAQHLLKSYREGAFSAWLVHAYGNRQTPYNLLLYYEFFQQLPSNIKPLLERLPKQAAYTLASRKGEMDKKIELIENYEGRSKSAILSLIRQRFPLSQEDARKGCHPVITHLRQALRALNHGGRIPLDHEGKAYVEQLLKACQRLLLSDD